MNVYRVQKGFATFWAHGGAGVVIEVNSFFHFAYYDIIHIVFQGVITILWTLEVLANIHLVRIVVSELF